MLRRWRGHQIHTSSYPFIAQVRTLCPDCIEIFTRDRKTDAQYLCRDQTIRIIVQWISIGHHYHPFITRLPTVLLCESSLRPASPYRKYTRECSNEAIYLSSGQIVSSL